MQEKERAKNCIELLLNNSATDFDKDVIKKYLKENEVLPNKRKFLKKMLTNKED